MKTGKIILPLVTALVITVTSSCKKDVLETVDIPVTGDYSSLGDFYAQNGADFQTYYINPVENSLIIANNGTQIILNAYSLSDSNGLPPSDTVTVRLREVYDIKTMVLSHLSTMSNGSILQSGGMLYLEFTANSTRYYLNSPFQVVMPSDSTPVSGMLVFWGMQEQNTDIVWVLADSGNFVLPDSGGYNLFLDSLDYDWINCDKFYQAGNPANVTITPQVNAERSETVDLAVYLLFPSINSVMNVSNVAGPQSVIANNIPVGMQAVAAVIGVGRITHKAYFGKTNFTVTSPQSVSVSVVQATDQQIFDSLSNL